MERQPESEPEFESADEGLADDLANLSIAPAVPVVDLTTFPALAAYPHHAGAFRVESVGPRHISVTRLQGITPILSLEPPRFYIVWRLPGYTGTWNLVGIHEGAGTRAYEALVTLNRGFANLRFRRVNNLGEARIEFVREAGRHRVPQERVDYRFTWQ